LSGLGAESDVKEKLGKAFGSKQSRWPGKPNGFSLG